MVFNFKSQSKCSSCLFKTSEVLLIDFGYLDTYFKSGLLILKINHISSFNLYIGFPNVFRLRLLSHLLFAIKNKLIKTVWTIYIDASFFMVQSIISYYVYDLYLDCFAYFFQAVITIRSMMTLLQKMMMKLTQTLMKILMKKMKKLM